MPLVAGVVVAAVVAGLVALGVYLWQARAPRNRPGLEVGTDPAGHPVARRAGQRGGFGRGVAERPGRGGAGQPVTVVTPAAARRWCLPRTQWPIRCCRSEPEAAPFILPLGTAWLRDAALQVGVPVEQLALDAGIADPNTIPANMVLVVWPRADGTAVIQPGETLPGARGCAWHPGWRAGAAQRHHRTGQRSWPATGWCWPAHRRPRRMLYSAAEGVVQGWVGYLSAVAG
ncbi:MAG: hypothetical protein WKF82_02865 [Nocardioidaceae bacterium]